MVDRPCTPQPGLPEAASRGAGCGPRSADRTRRSPSLPFPGGRAGGRRAAECELGRPCSARAPPCAPAPRCRAARPERGPAGPLHPAPHGAGGIGSSASACARRGRAGQAGAGAGAAGRSGVIARRGRAEKPPEPAGRPDRGSFPRCGNNLTFACLEDQPSFSVKAGRSAFTADTGTKDPAFTWTGMRRKPPILSFPPHPGEWRLPVHSGVGVYELEVLAPSSPGFKQVPRLWRSDTFIKDPFYTAFCFECTAVSL